MGAALPRVAAIVAACCAAALAAWWSVYWLISWMALPSLRTDFYGGMSAADVRSEQARVGIKTLAGSDWVHLGWLADPERERYRVYIGNDASGGWRLREEVGFGSALLRGLEPATRRRFRVEAVSRGDGGVSVLGEVEVQTSAVRAVLESPRIAGAWRELFRPTEAGDYVNDHSVFRDRTGWWRLLGITGPGRGDYERERWLAQGKTGDLASAPMSEEPRVADYGEAAWAPHVVVGPGGDYHLFWSPHRAHHAVSPDGVDWERREDAIARPFSWFFRDPMVLEVTPGQWLMYASARGWYFSRVDAYQSFDLEHWQYIGSPWRSGWGSERNAVVGSAESPFVIARGGNYYLSITYNNESGILAPIALAAGRWLGGDSYNDTLVFASGNPYDFGLYRGRARAENLVAELEAHAPEYIFEADTGRWWISTCGWPLAATLTSGEVAIAPLGWQPVVGRFTDDGG